MLRYKAHLKYQARQLRKDMTDLPVRRRTQTGSERILWSRLRGKQVSGVQFYRQKPIGNYMVDFFAPRTKLVIEVDGSQHFEGEQAEKDRQRDDYVAGVGRRVLRFTSREVVEETDAVIEVIYRTMGEQLTREKSPSIPLYERGKMLM
jgi:very-short-patch-repair endonuclease